MIKTFYTSGFSQPGGEKPQFAIDVEKCYADFTSKLEEASSDIMGYCSRYIYSLQMNHNDSFISTY